jgi:transposase
MEDVHQGSVVACIIITERRKSRRKIRTFGTMTKDLEALRDWLKAEGITHVAMESTGVYWRPVHNLLHGSFALIVAKTAFAGFSGLPEVTLPAGVPITSKTCRDARRM